MSSTDFKTLSGQPVIPSRSLPDTLTLPVFGLVFSMHTALFLTLTAQPNEPKTRFAKNGSSWQRFGEQNNFSILGYES